MQSFQEYHLVWVSVCVCVCVCVCVHVLSEFEGKPQICLSVVSFSSVWQDSLTRFMESLWVGVRACANTSEKYVKMNAFTVNRCIFLFVRMCEWCLCYLTLIGVFRKVGGANFDFKVFCCHWHLSTAFCQIFVSSGSMGPSYMSVLT